VEKIFSVSYRKAAVMIAPDQIVILNIVKRLFIQKLYFLLRSRRTKEWDSSELISVSSYVCSFSIFFYACVLPFYVSFFSYHLA